MVKEVERRLLEINIHSVLESGYIEEMIRDYTWSLFPQIQNTERPDSVVGLFLEGKVCNSVPTDSQRLIAPAVFTSSTSARRIILIVL